MRVLMGIFFSLIMYSHNLMAQTTEPSSMVLAGSVDYQSQLGRVLGMLLFILALIFVVVWLMKKIGVTGHTAVGSLSIKACLPLSNKEKLYVIQVGEEQLLIGLSANGITPLKTLQNPIDSGVNSFSVSGSFSKKLQEMMLAKKPLYSNTSHKETEEL